MSLHGECDRNDGLYAFQFDLSFVPGVLAADAVDEGAFLEQGGTTLFFPGRIDNSTGAIQMMIDTLASAMPGVSGNGPLAGVSFRALGAGTSPLTLSHVILLDSQRQEIIASTAGASITVVPEPAAFALSATGLVGLATVKWRKQSRAGFRKGKETRVT